MKILVTGATGLVGRPLVAALLSRGHEVRYLTTSTSKSAISGASAFLWNPAAGEIDVGSLDGVEVIIHLAGSSIGRRWTNQYKREIIASRVASAQLLYNTLSGIVHQVKFFVSASGIGIYPDSLTRRYQEDSAHEAESFIGRVAKIWERAADDFAQLGIQVAKVRTGLVMSESGGALQQIARPVRWGLGAPMGSGQQIVSWIHIDDLVQIIALVIEQRLQGAYNAVSPNPVSQYQLTHEIAAALGKRIWLPPIPSSILKIVLGEMASLLLEGQYVESAKISSAGFNFKFPEIRGALKSLTA